MGEISWGNQGKKTLEKYTMNERRYCLGEYLLNEPAPTVARQQ